MSHAETTLTQSALVAIITSSATGVLQLGKVMTMQARQCLYHPHQPESADLNIWTADSTNLLF